MNVIGRKTLKFATTKCAKVRMRITQKVALMKKFQIGINQLDLFNAVMDVYAHSDSPIHNDVLYKRVIKNLSASENILSEKSPVGNNQQSYNLFKRKVRWFQQTLKHAGVLDKVPDKRGEWCIKRENKNDLDKILPNLSVIGFSTKLGVAIIGYSQSVFAKLNEPIHLILTSPEYPLRNPRKYGNVTEPEYVDWVCKTIEPVVKNLVDGGVLTLNISNDIFLPHSAARSLYRERLVIALYERLGLYKMDEIPWVNLSKPPGPFQYASKRRVQLNVGWEAIYYFSNNPDKVITDNRRVLEPHTEDHLKLINSGGEKRTAVKSDGAYRIKEGSYGRQTEGRIPKNVIFAGTSCAENRKYKRDAEELGYQPHGAMMPIKVPDFLIRLFTKENELVVDPFAGSFTTAKAAENLNRRWIGVDPVVDYVMGASCRFQDCVGFKANFL
jgi:site-specific DNA-methyltransferase (cytosine-N4-specific)